MADHRKATENGLVYFNRRQLITVSSLFVAGFVVVFFLGVLIGQSVEERKLLRTEGQAVGVPVGSNAPGDELAFCPGGDGGRRTVPVGSNAPGDELELTFRKVLTTPKPPAATELSPDPKPPRDPKPLVQGPTDSAPAPWTVQVFSSRSRAKADGLVASLRRQGYGAYAVSVEIEGKTFYRVRVGRYGSRREALADLQRLRAADFKKAEIWRNG